MLWEMVLLAVEQVPIRLFSQSVVGQSTAKLIMEGFAVMTLAARGIAGVGLHGDVGEGVFGEGVYIYIVGVGSVGEDGGHDNGDDCKDMIRLP